MIEYKLLKELEQNPAHTQRSLATHLNVSLGKINYVLAGLTDKGIIKARKLRNHPEKIRWQYILTPKGMREKVALTQRYLRRRIREFENLRKEIEELKGDLS
ncbi:MAG: MarR family EPS-associated transcriptional regulator [Chitinivibrionales bacterium]|nr:MarR family EPS-associated transcriptional regulator [Chitinivibrionales bacterium]MBD3394609.1 MarR family EPS-associated transcriptional regulator [Chitinivibrionales bacterium]